jgi:hypothetical protein
MPVASFFGVDFVAVILVSSCAKDLNPFEHDLFGLQEQEADQNSGASRNAQDTTNGLPSVCVVQQRFLCRLYLVALLAPEGREAMRTGTMGVILWLFELDQNEQHGFEQELMHGSIHSTWLGIMGRP